MVFLVVMLRRRRMGGPIEVVIELNSTLSNARLGRKDCGA